MVIIPFFALNAITLKIKSSSCPKAVKRRHIQLDIVAKQAIVICRYGRFERGLPPLNTLREVALAHNVPVTTVNRVINEFHDNDG